MSDYATSEATSSEIEQKLLDIKDKDITDLSARDARFFLDKFLLRSSGYVAETAIKGKFVGTEEVIDDFALMISDKVGGKLSFI